MRNSISELFENLGYTAVELLEWLKNDVGIDTSGLLWAMDWYWFIFFQLSDFLSSSQPIDRKLPAVWFWGWNNARHSHAERPWNPYTQPPFYPF
jgi:hypothetical protein